MADLVPQILERCAACATGARAESCREADRGVPEPQILEQSVEVSEQGDSAGAVSVECVSLLLNAVFVVQQLLTGVFGGLVRVVVRLQKHKRQHGWTCPQPSPSLSCGRSWCWTEVRTRVW